MEGASREDENEVKPAAFAGVESIAISAALAKAAIDTVLLIISSLFLQQSAGVSGLACVRKYPLGLPRGYLNNKGRIPSPRGCILTCFDHVLTTFLELRSEILYAGFPASGGLWRAKKWSIVGHVK
jgi:hypothetical protein